MKVCVIGSGYVGLVTGACLASMGHDVVCVDKDPSKVDAMLNAKPHFYEPKLEELLKSCVKDGSLTASSDLQEALKGSDISMIAVGTPSADDGSVDLSFVKAVAEEIGTFLKTNDDPHTVVVKSTVVPTTTQDVVKPILEKTSGKSVGDFGLGVNPEFLREGSAVSDFMTPDRIVLGYEDETAQQALKSLYEGFDCPIIETSYANAELIKYTTNSLLATMISFSNDIAYLAEQIEGADEGMVMQGVHADRRLTSITGDSKAEITTYLKGGLGFGGSCLPKDVKALNYFAKTQKAESEMLNAVLNVNAKRMQQVAANIERILGNVKGKTIGIAGLAFKAGTDDVRESSALKLIEILKAKGATLKVHDGLVKDDFGCERCDDLKALAKDSDMVVITTPEADYKNADWNALAKSMNTPNIYDGRGVIAYDEAEHSFHYFTVGKAF